MRTFDTATCEKINEYILERFLAMISELVRFSNFFNFYLLNIKSLT